MPAPNERQPWPMKWIVIGIMLVVVPYTFLTLRYRKEGPAFQPYADMKNRANVSRLLAAGYQRLPIMAQRPADDVQPRDGATLSEAPGGLPLELRATLVEAPLLPAEITSVRAAALASTLLPYAMVLTCALPDDRHQLAGADLYVRDQSIVIAATFEKVARELNTRSRLATVLLTIPAGTLEPGRYSVTVAAQRAGRSWELEVR